MYEGSFKIEFCALSITSFYYKLLQVFITSYYKLLQVFIFFLLKLSITSHYF